MSPGERLVHIVDEVPELDATAEADASIDPAIDRRPVLVMVLEGFLDAGRSAALAADHLASIDPGRVVATFDIDEVYDYRARRPPISFVRDHYADYEAPRLVVRLHHDTAGTPYLLLRGAEPDIRWEAFARAVRSVVERFDVRSVISLGAVPMAAPHTRPVMTTEHGNRACAQTIAVSSWQGELRVPSSAQALVELRLGEWDHPAQGAVVHVPHYLAQMAYPQAALTLLDYLERASALAVDLTDLRESARETEAEITAYLEENDEVREVVHGLEQQYDTFQRGASEGQSLLRDDGELPSGEELGQQFEQFLAGLDGPEPPDERS